MLTVRVDVGRNDVVIVVNAGRENAGEARLVAGIASGFAEPKTVY